MRLSHPSFRRTLSSSVKSWSELVDGDRFRFLSPLNAKKLAADVLQPWRTQFLAFLINTHVPWLCSTHSGFPRAHRDDPSAQAARPVAGAIGLPR